MDKYLTPELRKQLTETIIDVCEKRQTEFAHSKNYAEFARQPNQNYYCAICDQLLFEKGAKMESRCGWPAFSHSVKDSIEYLDDTSHNMVRVETRCKRCGAHLGHVFEGETGPESKRYCINAVSIGWHDDKGQLQRFMLEAGHG